MCISLMRPQEFYFILVVLPKKISESTPVGGEVLFYMLLVIVGLDF